MQPIGTSWNRILRSIRAIPEAAVTNAQPRIYIIGVGSDGLSGLTARARDLLLGAGLVLGSDHTLRLLPELAARKQSIGPDLQEVVRLLEREIADRKQVVIAAGGDP